MKTIKSILLTATLISASLVSTVFAQDAQTAPKHEFAVAIGDSVMIRRECQQYSTGEKPSVWVWDKVHTVRQLGTKKYPDGVLLMNIYSWICDTCLIPVNGHAQEASEEASMAQAVERAAYEKAIKEGKNPVEAAAAAAEAAAAAQAAAAEEAKTEKAGEATEEKVTEEGTVTEEETATAGKEAEDATEETAAEEETSEEEGAAKESVKQNYHRFTIGARGGASALMHHADRADAQWGCGGDVVLDLQYAHYWAKDGRPVDLGIITGIGLGYHQSNLAVDSDLTTFQKDKIDYTVLAKNVKETDHALQLEVPVMFSLIHDNGLFFNVGPKFMIPVYAPYNQSVNQDETHVSAVFNETGVLVTDNVVTGQYTGQQPESKNGIQFNVNVMLTAEIGYEWILKSGNSLGLGAYANYSVFNSYKNKTSDEGLFTLTPPSEESVAQLDVLSATHAYADKLGYFDAGVKIAYHFNFPKKVKK